jgi:NAD(P)-dependent dehydrogenase (short-subunit alcohol dehydrogenase family)
MKKTVLITGVSGGIGRATAEIFAEQKWRVIGVDCLQHYDHASVDHFIQADIADPDELQAVFSTVREKTDALNALVNNAAVQVCKPLVETTLEEWDRIMSTNLRSVFLGVQKAFPFLKVAKGAIVNVSSVHAMATSKSIAAYAASKGALLALTRAMAIEFGEDGVRVNAVLPGAVETAMLHAGLERGHVHAEGTVDMVHELGRKHVLGRVGQPVEIGKAISFLADNNQSSFMTGQALIIDGGATARLSTE